MVKSMYYVYLLENRNGQYYIGYSADLKRRILEHKHNKVNTTSRLKFDRLVYYEAYNSEVAAKDREKKLKQFGSAYHGLIKRLELN